jgi:acetyl esterase/lipase
MSESILEREPPPPGLLLRYGPEPQHHGELRLPDCHGLYPCVIAIHGGFWRSRYDLKHLAHFCAALTATGFATWNIEYRRVGDPGGGWPGTFHDVARAAQHLFDIAPEHGIDADRVIVAGHSAGGDLALWLAGVRNLTPHSPVHAAPLPLRGAVSLAGVVDLHRAWALGLSEHAVGDMLGGGPGDMPDRYDAASPAAMLPLGVPHVVVHGVDDPIVPVAMAEQYHQAASAQGDTVTLLTLPDTGHFELIDPQAPPWPRIASAVQSLAGQPPGFGTQTGAISPRDERRGSQTRPCCG